MERTQTHVDSLVKIKQIENIGHIGSSLGIVWWTCKGLRHYSKDCEIDTYKSSKWSKSNILTHTIGLQTNFIGME